MSVLCSYRNVNRPINFVRKDEVHGNQYSVLLYFAQRNITGPFCLVRTINNTHLSLHVIKGKAVKVYGGYGGVMNSSTDT